MKQLHNKVALAEEQEMCFCGQLLFAQWSLHRHLRMAKIPNNHRALAARAQHLTPISGSGSLTSPWAARIAAVAAATAAQHAAPMPKGIRTTDDAAPATPAAATAAVAPLVAPAAAPAAAGAVVIANAEAPAAKESP